MAKTKTDKTNTRWKARLNAINPVNQILLDHDAMKQILLCSTIMIALFCGSACSKQQVTGVLDDIARDTYEKKAREQSIENMGDPAYKAPPTYDQYQRERKKLISKQEASTAAEDDL